MKNMNGIEASEVLQIGEEGADIEMFIAKNIHGVYFVTFYMYTLLNNKRVLHPSMPDLIPVHTYMSVGEIHEKWGSYMNGQKVSI